MANLPQYYPKVLVVIGLRFGPAGTPHMMREGIVIIDPVAVKI